MNTALSLRRATRGFSLIELMVAMSIGLILTLIIGQIFINSRAVFASTDNLSRLQENSRFAFGLIGRSVRAAGYKSDSRANPDGTLYPPTTPVLIAIQGTDGGIAAGSGLSDKITLTFEGSGAMPPGNADGTVQDCLGNRLAFAQRVTNTFLIQNDATNNNEPTLYCNTDAAAPTTCNVAAGTCVPLVPGVENMQVLYGEDFTDWSTGTTTDGSADRWVTAAATPAPAWNKIVSIRVSLLMRTADRVADRPSPLTTYTLSGTNVIAGNDQRLRRTFTMVINLRNQSQ